MRRRVSVHGTNIVYPVKLEDEALVDGEGKPVALETLVSAFNRLDNLLEQTYGGVFAPENYRNKG